MPDADAAGRADLDLLAGAARDAGALALTYFRRDPDRWMKEGNSVVTEADIAVDDFLRERLVSSRPDHGWISEESEDNATRLGCARVFVVDPIDGTRAFVDGRPDWTVSLAIAEAGRPVAAALFAPVHDELFLASAGAGASLNGAPIAPSRHKGLKGALIAGSKNVISDKALAATGIRRAGFIPSLAYRLALVGDGRIDGAAARPDAYDWDLAAADLIVHEAGGLMTDIDGRQIRYNERRLRHPALVAAAAGVHEALRQRIASSVRHR
ncbi:3'(2'),5'-bisphosphate nucleotidase CysQ [Rhodobium gokarnense]|uniref:Myo-inositol-1(Or 4)-monophosphatase n=1 Tax=Rhodobium gokarnense TaxID=364296 RepID=A0ABT3HCP4_9HYPH|nr:3'(2'),5'-bisphosphate nucleotidase CysQ [Rhodobium gokarnense]MCW2308172.1 myo-inositol-1(or 4)-monophosphatase [Rhodobium gokarnense]